MHCDLKGTMKFIIVVVATLLSVYINYTDAIIPKDCTNIADECKKHAPQVKEWLIDICCKKCGKPIPFNAAKKYVDEAVVELSSTIIPYVRQKIPKLPKDITPEWISHVAKSIEESFNHHEDLCKFDLQNPQHRKEIEKCKGVAIKKALPKAMGMLPLAGECKKGNGIPTHIMNDIPKGKAKPPPIHILNLMKDKCGKLCKDLKG